MGESSGRRHHLSGRLAPACTDCQGAAWRPRHGSRRRQEQETRAPALGPAQPDRDPSGFFFFCCRGRGQPVQKSWGSFLAQAQRGAECLDLLEPLPSFEPLPGPGR